MASSTSAGSSLPNISAKVMRSGGPMAWRSVSAAGTGRPIVSSA
jgi:hypothetical protein